ncbi:flagellar hook-length control protein FliK [Legionella sp. km535]|uniref:flagellar hook-length control protein FliK n=1 Tax=Legionella sp. km535 TaxID=2498107 RepID=UPI000F8D2D3E|nr:flagellar hook-length control protein FliK [Legionella sp. km535]RUR17700.1 flagellar hook-length control protein FliK [Legionella sp. km535]
MIDLNNLILNSFKFSDANGAGQEQIVSAEFPDTKSDQNDDLLNDAAIDPGAFVLLFTELLLNDSLKKDGLSEESDSKNTDLINEKANEAKADAVDAASTSAKDQVVMTDISQILPQNDQLTETVKISTAPTERLDSNIALTWIDSDQFEPPLPATSMSAMNLASEAENTEQPLDGKSNGRLGLMHVSDQNVQTDLLSDENSDAQLTDQDSSKDGNERLIHDVKNLSIETLVNKSSNGKLIMDQTIQPEYSALNNNPQMTSQSELINNQFSNYLTDANKTKHIDISLPLSDAQWADKFSDHIVWLGQHGVKSALIKLNPEDLGPLEINIKVVKDSASVNIISHSSHARDVVDQALPRLREMMANQGLDLAEVNVGMDRNPHQSDQNPSGFVKEEAIQGIEDGALITPLKKQVPKGLIDYFA